MKNPLVSVVIPVKEVSYFIIFENLPGLEKQTYKNFEVIVLPNQHTNYDIELLKKYKWLRIIPTGKVTRPAEKRDIGVKEAKGEVIAFIDDDAYPHEQWLEKAVELFAKENVEAVCGPGALPPNGNVWEYIFDEVLKTWIGAGGYSYRFVKGKQQYVDDYPSMNFLIQKKVFEELGGFNSEYWPGEDSKLCNDLVYKKNGKILYHPDVLIYHHRRNSLEGFLKQHGNYGFHRGAFFAHGDQNSRRFGYLIPTFFVVYLVLFLGLALIDGLMILAGKTFTPLHTLTFILSFPLIMYIGIASYLFFNALLNTKNLNIALGAPMVLFLTHVRYGIEFIKGFITGYKNKDNIYG